MSPTETAEPIETPFGCGLEGAQGTTYFVGLDPQGKGQFEVRHMPTH